MVDMQAVCPPLTASERARFDELVAQAKVAAQPEADRVRAAYVDENAEAMATRTGMSKEEAVRVLESQCGGVLLPAVGLVFADKSLKGCTVGDVLTDPERFDQRSRWPIRSRGPPMAARPRRRCCGGATGIRGSSRSRTAAARTRWRAVPTSV